MVDPFWIKLALSFVVGGIWVTITTVAAERFGTKLGGVIGGLPSTSIVSFFFIGFTQGVQATVEATTISPLALSFSGVFMIVFARLSHKGFLRGLLAAIGVWLALSALMLWWGVEAYWGGVLFCIVLLSCVHYYLEHTLKIESAEGSAFHPSALQVLFRAVFGGTVIATAVLLSRVGGPLWGGVFAMFPAMYTSTLLILGWSRGAEFARATTKSLMLTGFISLMFFITAVRYSYPALGLWYGTLFSYAVSLIVAVPTYMFIKAKMK